MPTKSSTLSRARRLTRDDESRYLDYGIKLWVVQQDLQNGIVVLDDTPPVKRIDGPVLLGGKLDTATRRIVGPADNWIVWFAGREQADAILDDDETATRILHYSAEGGGKTDTASKWGIVQLIRCAEQGLYGHAGCTAPTAARLNTLLRGLQRQVPIDRATQRSRGSWGTLYQTDTAQEIRFASGMTFELKSTKRQSAATGAPIQGYNWRFSIDDELQDTAENGADTDIEARLRVGRRSRRYCTATAKDSPTWRTFRDEKLSLPDWKVHRTPFYANQFVWPEHWDRLKRACSPREWQRRGLAMDVGPENQVYSEWSRDQNLMLFPTVAKDVTAKVLQRYGRNRHMLIGHDPGELYDVSVMLKAYQMGNERRHRWVVVGELTTQRTTSEQHFSELRQVLRSQWDIQTGEPEDGCAHVRCDPYGMAQTKADREVYLEAKRLGFEILSAAFSKSGVGTGQVPKEARIETVRRLMLSAAAETWLYVACDQSRKPAAEQLVRAIELSERDETGEAETQRKGKADLSHWPAALGYALWPFERVRDVVGVRLGGAVA